MQRNKILAGAVLLMFTFFGATASKVSTYKSADASSTATPGSALVEPGRIKQYNSRQQKLRLALKKYFDQAIASGDIVGAGVSIVHGDSILISDGFGKRNINGTARVDGETIFRLGSLSKGFAGVLAASFQAEGKLDWDDKVTDYIPEFKLGDDRNTAKIKVAHILSHSSGTPYHSYTNLVEDGLPVATIAKRFNKVKPQSEPGLQYSYQNAMFALCQEVMLKASGEKVKTSFQKRFFTPLGMSNTSMDHHSLLQEKNVAMPHTKRRRGWRSLPLTNRYYNAVSAGGINASSLDMAKWMRFLLGHNPEVLKESTINQAFNPFITIDYNNKYYQRWPGHKQSHYGFGWRIHTYQESAASKEKIMWHHGGSVNNYRNEIALFPESDIGICVLLNGNSKLARTVIPDLYALVKSLKE